MKRNQENNPRYPHYWIKFGLSQEEAEEKANYKRRSGSHRCIEYWLERGFSEEEGRERISQTQSKCRAQKTDYTPTPETIEKQRQSLLKRNQIEIWIQEYGEQLGIKKFEEFKQKQSENGTKAHYERLARNPNTYIETSVRRVEYWIAKGLNEFEAALMVSKHQSRGLKFYVKKYGEAEGTKKWEEKNQKWYDSFYNSDNNLEEINKKRKDNAHVGYYNKDSIDSIPFLNFYLLTFTDLDGTIFIKYGLTKQNKISKRWKVHLNYKVTYFEKFDAYSAVLLEELFHKKFKKTYNPQIIKTTECFEHSEENYNQAISLIEDFKNAKY